MIMFKNAPAVVKALLMSYQQLRLKVREGKHLQVFVHFATEILKENNPAEVKGSEGTVLLMSLLTLFPLLADLRHVVHS